MPFMSTKKSTIRVRFLIAISLLVLSILSSVFISLLSNQKGSYLITTRELTPGQQILASDIATVKVNVTALANT